MEDAEIMKILFILLSGAGDVLMSTPLIKEIRKIYPKSQIDCLVMQGKITRDLLSNNPSIDNILYFNFQKEGLLRSMRFINSLRRVHYDLSIATYPQARLHYSIITYLIHSRKRIGFNYETHKFNLNKLFFTSLINEDFTSHVVINNLNAIKLFKPDFKVSSPHLVLRLSESDIKFSQDYRKKNNLINYVVMHAGSGSTKNFVLKRWPADRFAKLARRLHKGLGLKVVLAGGPDEKSLKEEVIKLSRLKPQKEIFNLESNILETAAIIRHADVVISNDSVMTHVSSAVGTPIIALFGPTSWENSGPFTQKRVVVCKRPKSVEPYKHGASKITNMQAESLKHISVNEIYALVSALIKKKG